MMQMSFDEILENESWYALVNLVPNSKHEKDQFHIIWTEKGHSIRKSFDDDLVLAKCLKRWLPAYVGESKILYRGENLERFQENKIGFCWSDSIKVARMFASGLNSYNSGGLLVSVNANKANIIAPPSRHSCFLGESEYTLDSPALKDIKIIERFPPSH